MVSLCSLRREREKKVEIYCLLGEHVKEEEYKGGSFIQILHSVLEEFSLNVDNTFYPGNKTANTRQQRNDYLREIIVLFWNICNRKVYKVEGTLYINYFFLFDLNLILILILLDGCLAVDHPNRC